MKTGDFIWVRPMRSRDKLHPAVVLNPAKISPGLAYRFGKNRQTTVGWRVALLDTLMTTGVVQIFEATEYQIARQMSPLEALAWSVADDLLEGF